MKINKVGCIITLLFLIVTVGLLSGFRIATKKTEGIEDAAFSTGNQNKCITYDETTKTIFVGTHDNQLVVFKEGQEIWRVTAGGPFSDLVLNADKGLIYGGNEDGSIYIYNISDGSAVNKIDVQRRVVAIDINNSGTKVAVATSTGSSKANILVYDLESGDELVNIKYTFSIAGVKYSKNDDTLFTVNKRGEISHLQENGDAISVYETNYTALQLIRQGDMLWTVCKDGSYYGFDEDLNIIRHGVVANNVNAVIATIGVDESNKYVIVGTNEGYLFIMNGQDRQIYTSDMSTRITGFTNIEGEIYMVGLADMIKLIHVENLANIHINVKIAALLKTLGIIFICITFVSLVMTFEGSRRYILHLLKEIWRHKMAYIMLMPTLLLIYFFNYRGIATAFIRAFTNWSKTNTSLAQIDYVGLENFRRMFTEGYFLIGMKNLILLMVTGIIKVLTMPLLVAWLVYNIRGDRRKYLHRFLFVLPIVVPGVISAMTWQKIYDPSIGLLNEILELVHLDSFKRVWLGDAHTAIWAVIFMGFPFVHAMAFLVYYGGLLNIGHDVEESAMIDGASKRDIFWKIQLPLIRPQISIMVTLQIIGTMQDFNSIFILTGGGPGTSTYVPALELYLNVAQFGRYGYACALGVILFVFTMSATLISNRLTKERE